MTFKKIPVINDLKFIITIYNKLVEDSPSRSDIFDLFGTPDRINPGLIGTMKSQNFKSLYWGWGQNGLKRCANSYTGGSI